MLTGLRWYQKLGLALVIAAMAIAIAQLVSAETLQCWPAHTPYRSPTSVFERIDPDLFAVIVAIGAVLFMM